MKSKILMLCLMLSVLSAASAEELALSRDECRRMALEANEDIRIAENSRLQADLDKKVADIARLPKLDGSATALLMLPDIDMMGSTLQSRGTYVAGLQIVQPIYTGGKITAGRNLAKIGQKSSAEKLRLTKADVTEQADNFYWTYVAVRSKVEMMDHFIAMMDTLLEQTSAAVEVGLAVDNDLLRIESKRSELLYQREKVINGERMCRMALCNAIGIDPDTEILPTDTLPACTPPADKGIDITQRPELHLLEMQVDASEQQVKMARADFLPTVGMSVGYSYYGNIKMKGMADMGDGNYMPFSQEYRDGIFMGVLSVNIPIFHWGEGSKKVRKSRYEVENARLSLEHNRSLMELEARQASMNLSDGENMIRTADIALQQAEENLRVMKDRYNESMASLTDLLDAQTQWHQARSNCIEAVTQYQIYLTAWQKANGRL